MAATIPYDASAFVSFPEDQPQHAPKSRAQAQVAHREEASCSCFNCCVSRAQPQSSESGTLDSDWTCAFQARRSEPLGEDIQSTQRGHHVHEASVPAFQPYNPRLHRHMLEQQSMPPPIPASRVMQLRCVPYGVPSIEERLRMEAYPPSQSQPGYVHRPLELTQMIQDLGCA
jgi:hypothetical protein